MQDHTYMLPEDQLHILAEMLPGVMDTLRKKAERISACADKRVGAQLYTFNYHHMDFARVAQGFNIIPPSCKETCVKEHDPMRQCQAIHAEMMAVADFIHSNTTTHPCVCICTHEPCFDCAKSLISIGVRMVVFEHTTYVQKSGRAVWLEHRNNESGTWLNTKDLC